MKRLTQEQFEEWLKEVGGSIAVEEFKRLNEGGDTHLIEGKLDYSFDLDDYSILHLSFWNTINYKYEGHFSTLPEPVNRTLFDVLGLLNEAQGEGYDIYCLSLCGDGSGLLTIEEHTILKEISEPLISDFSTQQEYINHLYDTISEYIKNKK